MNDASAVLPAHTKKNNIPSNRLEYKYIEHCTDGSELEGIYKELIGGEAGSFPFLEKLTLDRIRNIRPNSQILRQDTIPSNISTLINDESQQTNQSLNTIIDSTSDRDNTTNIESSTFSKPVINIKPNLSTPNSPEEWEKFEQKVSLEFNSDDENDQTKNKSYEQNKRLHMAEQHRLNGNTALESKNYQQSIDSYTNSLVLDNNNLLTYMNRATAYAALFNFEASIKDCSQVLSMNSKYVEALFLRASCYRKKQRDDQAICDINYLLTIEPDHREAQEFLSVLSPLQQMDSSDISGIDEDQPLMIEEDEEQAREYQYAMSTLNGDDDNMPLGDEAGVGLVENLSDDEGHISRSVNVSPNTDDGSDTPELVNRKTLETPPSTPSIKQNINKNVIDPSRVYTINENNRRNQFSSTSYNRTNDDYNDLYDYHNNEPLSSNHLPSYKQSTMSSNSRTNNNDADVQSPTIDDTISNSNFGSIIQSWLRDLVALQPNRYSTSYYNRLWSRSPKPWSIDKLQNEVERFNRFNDYRDAIEVSKKMLHNGSLDYHYHAEHIVTALFTCAQCYLKYNDYIRVIQYTTEALQYNKNDSNSLSYRAKAFENEKFFLFSYADVERISTDHFNYYTIQCAREKLINELNSTEGENWREKLSNDDDEYCLTYFQIKSQYSEDKSYEWYQTSADQFYRDGCFILAIRFYTYCIEHQSKNIYSYLKRASCYLKVFEPQKVIDDCDIVLKEDENNLLALYQKASAYKMSRDEYLYESTLKEYIKLQPENQIILAEYCSHRHEQIPRKRRRIRRNSIVRKILNENNLSYEELEQIRLENIESNLSLDLLNSNDIRKQCSYILHLSEENLNDSITTKSIEIIINISRIMIQAEQNYQEKNGFINLPFSYIKFCLNVLMKLTEFPQIDLVLSTMDENSRRLLDDLISLYSSMSEDMEKLNRLKKF